MDRRRPTGRTSSRRDGAGSVGSTPSPALADRRRRSAFGPDPAVPQAPLSRVIHVMQYRLIRRLCREFTLEDNRGSWERKFLAGSSGTALVGAWEQSPEKLETNVYAKSTGKHEKYEKNHFIIASLL